MKNILSRFPRSWNDTHHAHHYTYLLFSLLNNVTIQSWTRGKSNTPQCPVLPTVVILATQSFAAAMEGCLCLLCQLRHGRSAAYRHFVRCGRDGRHVQPYFMDQAHGKVLGAYQARNINNEWFSSIAEGQSSFTRFRCFSANKRKQYAWFSSLYY